MRVLQLISIAVLWLAATAEMKGLALAQAPNGAASAPAKDWGGVYGGYMWVWWVIAILVILAVIGFFFGRLGTGWL